MQSPVDELLSCNPKSAPLIASDRVEGSAVCRPNGERIGTVKRLMVDKKRGNIAYAVLSFGGILGFGGDHFPIAWAMLSFDEKLNAYKVDLSDEQVKGAQKSVGQCWDSGDRPSKNIYFDENGGGPYL